MPERDARLLAGKPIREDGLVRGGRGGERQRREVVGADAVEADDGEIGVRVERDDLRVGVGLRPLAPARALDGALDEDWVAAVDDVVRGDDVRLRIGPRDEEAGAREAGEHDPHDGAARARRVRAPALDEGERGRDGDAEQQAEARDEPHDRARPRRGGRRGGEGLRRHGHALHRSGPEVEAAHGVDAEGRTGDGDQAEIAAEEEVRVGHVPDDGGARPDDELRRRAAAAPARPGDRRAPREDAEPEVRAEDDVPEVEVVAALGADVEAGGGPRDVARGRAVAAALADLIDERPADVDVVLERLAAADADAEIRGSRSGSRASAR